MTAHDQNEASNRISITSLTMASDCRNSPIIERSCAMEPARGNVSIALGCILVGPLWRQFGQFSASAWVIGCITLPLPAGEERVGAATARENRAGVEGSPASADQDAGRRLAPAPGRAACAARSPPGAGTAR